MTPWTVASRLLCPWDYLGKNIGVNCHFLLQGIFLTQGWNLCLLHRRWILYYWLSGKGDYLIGESKHHKIIGSKSFFLQILREFLHCVQLSTLLFESSKPLNSWSLICNLLPLSMNVYRMVLFTQLLWIFIIMYLYGSVLIHCAGYYWIFSVWKFPWNVWLLVSSLLPTSLIFSYQFSCFSITWPFCLLLG